MPENELRVIMDSKMVGTLALLSLFFTPPKSTSSSNQKDEEDLVQVDEGEEIEGRGEKRDDDKVDENIKMNKWCWVFLGAWTVGEAGRVLKTRRGLSVPDHKVST